MQAGEQPAEPLHQQLAGHPVRLDPALARQTLEHGQGDGRHGPGRDAGRRLPASRRSADHSTSASTCVRRWAASALMASGLRRYPKLNARQPSWRADRCGTWHLPGLMAGSGEGRAGGRDGRPDRLHQPAAGVDPAADGRAERDQQDPSRGGHHHAGEPVIRLILRHLPGADGLPVKNGQFTVCVPDPRTHGCDKPYHDPSLVNRGASHNLAARRRLPDRRRRRRPDDSRLAQATSWGMRHTHHRPAGGAR